MKISHNFKQKIDMAKKRKATTKKPPSVGKNPPSVAKKPPSDPQDNHEEDSDDAEKERNKIKEQLLRAHEENENLKRKVQKLQTESNRVIDLAKQGRLSNVDVTLQANVISTARKVIFLKCPYIADHDQLVKCTRVVGRRMSIAEGEMETFVALYKATVNNAITTRRNANIQQVRKKLKGK